ncbi:MAG: hypothetical protein GY841_12485 [FCB group bacterium]|nr:hypothetical protein [FCB group bacterium]
MAVDSALKRFSATGLLMPFRGGCWPDTAGVSQGERWAVTWMYSGLAAISFGPLYNFIARNKTFNFNAINKIFNFIAKTKSFNYTAKPGP